MRHYRRVAAAVLAGLLLAGQGAGATPLPQAAHEARAAHIVPYEVRYEVSLKSAQDRAGIVLADGVLASRLAGSACEGWSTNSMMKVRFVFRREGTRETESRVVSWESADGNQFISRIERFLNGTPVERISVVAERKAAGLPFRLRMSMPEKHSALLEPQTLFPTAAMKRLLRAAMNGEKNLSLLFYEGDEDAAAQQVVAIIGKRRAPLAQAGAKGDEGARRKNGKAESPATPQILRELAFWPVSLAYYGPVKRKDGSKPTDKEREAARAGLPEYEVHFRLYENGITGDALLVYPDYVLSARVVSASLLPMTPCK